MPTARTRWQYSIPSASEVLLYAVTFAPTDASRANVPVAPVVERQISNAVSSSALSVHDRSTWPNVGTEASPEGAAGEVAWKQAAAA